MLQVIPVGQLPDTPSTQTIIAVDTSQLAEHCATGKPTPADEAQQTPLGQSDAPSQ